MTLIYLLISFISAPSFNLDDLYMEMSCDTYPYGIDASPMVRTKGRENPRIDSLIGNTMYGRLKGVEYKWDHRGNCIVPLCKEEHDLEWSNLWNQ